MQRFTRFFTNNEAVDMCSLQLNISLQMDNNIITLSTKKIPIL